MLNCARFIATEPKTMSILDNLQLKPADAALFNRSTTVSDSKKLKDSISMFKDNVIDPLVLEKLKLRKESLSQCLKLTSQCSLGIITIHGVMQGCTLSPENKLELEIHFARIIFPEEWPVNVFLQDSLREELVELNWHLEFKDVLPQLRQFVGDTCKWISRLLDFKGLPVLKCGAEIEGTEAEMIKIDSLADLASPFTVEMGRLG